MKYGGSPKIELDDAPSIVSEMISLICDKHWNRLSEYSHIHFSSIILDGPDVGPDRPKITECPHKSSCTRPFMRNTGPMFKRNNQATSLPCKVSTFSSDLLVRLRHLPPVRPPVYKAALGTASHGRYDCTQFIIRYHLLYSNLIPSHPVPQPSRALSARCGPYSILEDCPLYSRHPFP